MNRSPTLPVPSFSRSRSITQSGHHINHDGSQDHPTVAPQEPLLSSTNAQSTIPQIHTTTIAGGKQHRGRVSEALERLERTWYLEAFCLLCSAACAALIVIFLVAHNNTHVDSWQFYFSINTVVSSLGVIFKLTLLFAVSAALAQGKWTWFRKRSDTLSTFEAIDAGSRGTVGSLKLLLRMRGQRLVSAGALVVAFGFMVQPFLQAVISEYGRLVDADPSGTSGMSATIGRSRRLDGGTQCISTYADDYPKIDTTPDFVISASLYDGLNAAGSHGYQNVGFTCFLGNCTWPEYVSIAIRSTCFDISDHLKRTTPEAPGETTVSTTRKSSPSTSSAAADSAETSASGTDPEMAMYPTAAPLSAFSDHSTVNSMVASLQSIATPAAVTTSTDVSQESSESEAPAGYATVPLTVLSAFDDVSTVNSMVAPVRSTATRATAGLDKRASSRIQPSPLSSSSSITQASALWSDWTLDYLDLTLSNTNKAWRSINTFAVLQAAVVADPNLTINFKMSQTLLAAFTVIRADNSHTLGSADWDAANASAMECGLELALNVYNSSVVNNVLLEQIVASVSQKVPGSWLPSPGVNQSVVRPNGLKADPGTLDSNPIYHDTFLYRADYALDPAPLQRGDVGNFSIMQRTLLSTVDFLTSLIKQNNDNATVKGVLQPDQSVLHTYGSPILQPLFNQADTNATFNSIAKSMSNAVRNLGTEPIMGTTKQWVRFYQVRWAFLALPLSLFTIGTIFFILTIADAHKAHVPNWKANSIATMMYGPDEPLQRHLRTEAHTQSLGVASETVAKLEWFPEGFALTAADQPATKTSRPTTPVRDEEEHEMNALGNPTTPQTPGSNITLVDLPNVGGTERGDIRSVSPVFTGPGWSDVQIDDTSTPLGIRRAF